MVGGAGGDVLGGRPTLLWALALANLDETDQQTLLSLIDENSTVEQTAKLKQVEALYRKARVFEQAAMLVEKHEQRALEAAAKVESEAMQRLMLYLVDTVLEKSTAPEPQVVDVRTISSNLPITAK